MVSSANTRDKRDLNTIRKLRYYEESVLRLMLLVGQVDVVVVPLSDGREKIVASTMWIEPGVKADPSFIQLIRMKTFRVLRSWGFGVLKRFYLEFTPRTEQVKKRTFASKGEDVNNAWYLVIVATDPDHEGHGYASMMIRARFKKIEPRVIHLEASSPRARDIYSHLGFELGEEISYGKGKVDEFGIPARGEMAVGITSFVMAKWSH